MSGTGSSAKAQAPEGLADEDPGLLRGLGEGEVAPDDLDAVRHAAGGGDGGDHLGEVGLLQGVDLPRPGEGSHHGQHPGPAPGVDDHIALADDGLDAPAVEGQALLVGQHPAVDLDAGVVAEQHRGLHRLLGRDEQPRRGEAVVQLPGLRPHGGDDLLAGLRGGAHRQDRRGPRRRLHPDPAGDRPEHHPAVWLKRHQKIARPYPAPCSTHSVEGGRSVSRCVPQRDPGRPASSPARQSSRRRCASSGWRAPSSSLICLVSARATCTSSRTPDRPSSAWRRSGLRCPSAVNASLP